MQLRKVILLLLLFLKSGHGHSLDDYVAMQEVSLSGSSSKQIDTDSADECATKCEEETELSCRSFHYHSAKQQCVLMTENSRTAQVVNMSDVMFYEKRANSPDHQTHSAHLCLEGKGENYRGNISMTASRLTCQNWSEQNPHNHSYSPKKHLSKALVRNYCRNPDGSSAPWCYTTDPSVRWEYCNIPSCDASDHCLKGNGENYRGFVSRTASGYTCQRWSEQAPHSHSFSPEKHPSKNLVSNYCRNPDGSSALWCYTTNPAVRWEYCLVPSCDSSDQCLNGKGENYRGYVSTTASGYTCQHWRTQSPHSHNFSPEKHPSINLVSNYCRNPDGSSALWCYTTNPAQRWEYCLVPSCDSSDQCLKGKGENYRGYVSTTASGYTCQHWRAQSPHGHEFSPEKHPSINLVSNYCRNPDGSSALWCYTTNPAVRWEYCLVPSCDSSDQCLKGKGENYRGYVSTTASGYTCQHWRAQSPHGHEFSPEKHPSINLVSNYCRNPDGSSALWCYTTNPAVRWEYCLVPSCDSSDQCLKGKGENYRGYVSTTASGYTCQHWRAQSPHGHEFSPEKHPSINLVSNYCRNPDGSSALWCYTTNPAVRWEYCLVPSCDSSDQCLKGKGENYRGYVSTTMSGYTCQNWRAQSPHKHDFSPEKHPSINLVGNFCRNPDGEKAPWCYTTDPAVRWEYCIIPSC
ncbi:apolipoprotein(a)-like isoform X2 [Erinaceus europaeus]|uniref:Hepatocyte growth factor n=1 Tax=Erinaceus europaeus TaxID=9365 RepID=A0ABM3YJG5_ERIEU|nr:apolipoprotein(a)-like isoform X2 [Erinaceus europaeus]